MNKQALFSIGGLLLLCLVVVTVLHDWEGTVGALEGQTITAPALIAHGVLAKSYSEEDGQLQYQLTAQSLQQFDHQVETQLTLPRLAISDQVGHWLVEAQHGEVRDNNEHIIFSGDSRAENQERHIRLDTQQLHFFSKRNELEAPEHTDIRFQSGHTRAGSLKAELDSGVLFLEQGVTSEFTSPAP